MQIAVQAFAWLLSYEVVGTSGEDDWIQTARDIVREEFDQTYAFMEYDNEVVAMDKVQESPKFYYCRLTNNHYHSM